MYGSSSLRLRGLIIAVVQGKLDHGGLYHKRVKIRMFWGGVGIHDLLAPQYYPSI
jgi:hypothetical protein